MFRQLLSSEEVRRWLKLTSTFSSAKITYTLSIIKKLEEDPMRSRSFIAIGIVCSLSMVFLLSPHTTVQAQIKWKKYAGNPVLRPGATGSWEERIAYACVVREAHGYKMWYTGLDYTEGSNPRLRIGLASSPDGTTWTKRASNPVLDRGPPGSWDADGVGMPSVLIDGGIYKMWYLGLNYDAHIIGIGYATSSNGVSWTKYTGNPVLSPGFAQWDHGLSAGWVIYDGTRYKMWYTGNDPLGTSRIGYATSPDGISWSKYAGNPIFDTGAPGEWDESDVGIPSILFDGSSYEMWYSGMSSSNILRIGYATSSNGISWVRHPLNPVLKGTPGEWDRSDVTGPSVIYDGSIYHMWYTGFKPGGSGIGYARAFRNEPPVLRGGFVTPSSGAENSTFTYNVTYKDGDNDPPEYVRVWINKSGLPVGSSPYNMSFDSWIGTPDSWIDGANFIFSINLTSGGTDYTFAFSTYDGKDFDFIPEKAGPTVASPISPPTNIEARLSGAGLRNIRIDWLASENDTGPGGFVDRYDVLYGSSYDKEGSGYSVLGSVPATGLPSYSYSHVGGGEGDGSNYFYLVCAVNALNSTFCASNQAGKFTRPLSRGPNLVSIPLIQSDESIERVLQTVNWDKVWAFDSSTKEWRRYVKFKPYKEDLRTVDHTMGFWVNVIEDSSLTLAGTVPSMTTIPLKKGWNLIGFPSMRTNFTVSDLKSAIGALRVEVFHTLPPYNLRVLGNSERLEAGYGYWVKVTRNRQLVVSNP